MKRIYSYVFLMVILSFVFVINVNAECTSKIKRELKKEAETIDINYEIKSEKKTIKTDIASGGTYEYYEYSFDFNIYNLSNNVFIKYYNDLDSTVDYINSSDFGDNSFIFSTNNRDNIVNYYFEVYSLDTECDGELLTTKKIIKPKYNSYSDFSICQEDKYKEHKYCKRFIEKNLTLSEGDFYKWIDDINDDVVENKDISFGNKVLTFLSNYWYFIVGVIFIILIIVVILIIRNKRGRLE